MANRLSHDQAERKVTVDRLNLIVKLKENRNKHVSEYNEALAGYVEAANSKLDEAYDLAKKKIKANFELAKEKIKRFDKDYCKSGYIVLLEGITVELKTPQCFSEQYDTAISMFEWEVNATVEITHAEFKCFVEDKWDWTDGFMTISAMYNKKHG